jgi:hypothetical protein
MIRALFLSTTVKGGNITNFAQNVATYNGPEADFFFMISRWFDQVRDFDPFSVGTNQ